VVRAGKTKKLKIKLGELADAGNPALAASGSTGAGAVSPLGLSVEEIDAADRERLGIDQGVRVRTSTGPAAEAGIAPGDVITRLANKPVTSVAQFSKIVDALNSGKAVPVLIVRNGTPTFRALRVPD
jgi:serine protease Do